MFFAGNVVKETSIIVITGLSWDQKIEEFNELNSYVRATHFTV